MGFADQYIQKQKIKIINIEDDPHADLRFSVVIPCYDEPGLLKCLLSLYNSKKPAGAVEVIVVVNTPAGANSNVCAQNEKTYKELIEFCKKTNSPRFKIYPVLINDIPKKMAGAGYARKVGMNEAIKRFNMLDQSGGFILSLDADAICDANYFTAIEQHINKYPETNGFSVYFEHPLEGDDYPQIVYEGIQYYELDMRCFIEGLRYAGFPYAYHTIGSCFGVKALAYIKQGGMNMRQGGEDFYFLHKIIPMGHYYEVNTTKVMPSPRPSQRVPFGTGPWVYKFTIQGNKQMLSYNISAFNDIKGIFNTYNALFNVPSKQIKNYTRDVSKPMQDFLFQSRFEDAVLEINANCAGEKTFRKKFFHWFDAFRIVKYMHFVHNDYYKKYPVTALASSLLQIRYGVKPVSQDAAVLLDVYRKKQRKL